MEDQRRRSPSHEAGRNPIERWDAGTRNRDGLARPPGRGEDGDGHHARAGPLRPQQKRPGAEQPEGRDQRRENRLHDINSE